MQRTGKNVRISGSILVRKIEKLNRKVLVVEKRSYIGGNIYDLYHEHGIFIQRYGPHFPV